jgi:hypothetical protein
MAVDILSAAMRVYGDMMTPRSFITIALLFITSLTAAAQASPKCQVRPTTLTAMRHCYRALLIFSPRADDTRLKKQGEILDDDADDMMDRFVMLTPILPSAKNYAAPLDTPYVVLSAKEMQSIRERFHVPAESFLVLLLGEDGQEKLRSPRPVSAERLNALIDATPERKIERERPHAN